jgi:hypothetical protein
MGESKNLEALKELPQEIYSQEIKSGRYFMVERYAW